MTTFLSRYTDLIYAMFRFMLGALFAFHGLQKMSGYPGPGGPVPLMSLGGLAGVIELVTGTMIAVGFFGAWAGFLSSGTMAVAYFIGHASGGFLPIVNKGEPAVMYCFSFLLIAAMGSGRYSIDALLLGGRRRAPV